MGKIIKYVLLLSHLSLILGTQQVKESDGRDRPGNFTLGPKQHEFIKRALPLGGQGRRKPQPPRTKTMPKTLGLQSFAEPDWRRRNSSEFRSPSRRVTVPPFSQNLVPWRGNFKNGPQDFQRRGFTPKERPTRLYNQNKHDEFERNRRYHRNGRYQQHHKAKICDPCNSVPWVPLLKVPDSYRQHRTHLNDVHQNNFNHDFGFGSDTHNTFSSAAHSTFDVHNTFGSDVHNTFGADSHHAFATDAHNVLLPPVQLATPLEPVFDGTISSSFGLPVGNIPTGHGLLAPINPLENKFTRYRANTVDFSASLNYFPSQDLLGGNLFPELSPVPIVPIHDSGQFYQIPDLVPPPPAKGVDVSKVVLTITENNPPKPHAGKDLSSQSSSVKPQGTKEKKIGNLEIVKSVPLAEFTSSVDFPRPGSQQLLPLYPPLQYQDDHRSASDMNFLVPPPVKKEVSDTTFDSSKNGVLPFMNPPKHEEANLKESESAPKPLTSPSLSWLFSDHTGQPTSTESVSEIFAEEMKEIASIVNSELHPVSPIPPSPTADPSKGKKVQIIIPYTTKDKNGHDSNALESVHHEVFQPPVIKPQNHTGSISPIINNFGAHATGKTTFATPPPEISTFGTQLPVRGYVETHTTERSTFRTQLPNSNTYVNHPPNSDNFGTLSTHRHNFEVHSKAEPEDRYLREMHHIIASNIRELLRDEIEKTQDDQNYPLQNNIDNWTALEYSNHKTVEEKAPKEIISQALAVTSIPGTSISHLLIPSKKIPKEYFVTTPVPAYDEPVTFPYNATTTSVNSKPFTAKSYATTNVYAPTSNHERNYTEVTRGRVNHWGRLKENLVLPEARIVHETTAPAWTITKEKVEIVTPIPLTTKRNYTTYAFRRTTRQTRTTETPTTTTTQTSLLLTKLNYTKLERVSTKNSTTTNATVTVTVTPVPTTVSVENVTWTLPSDSGFNKSVNKSEDVSINDLFPFRNKELPWESALNVTQPATKNGRQRNSLIKQVNLPKQKTKSS